MPKVQETIFIIDDEQEVRESLAFQLDTIGYQVKPYASCQGFLTDLAENTSGCLLLDVRMPIMTGPELQEELLKRGVNLPIIFLSGYADVPVVVNSVQQGAVDFLTKPVDSKKLVKAINKALEINHNNQQLDIECKVFKKRIIKLTQREREVLQLVLDGDSNKQIASKLTLSIRTVEHHRSHILLKTDTDSFLVLASLIDTCQHQ